MDEPEPMPAFTFNADGPTTITHPDGTVSVHAQPPDDTPATTELASAVSATATQADDTPGSTLPPESPDPQPGATSAVPEPSGDTGDPGTGITGSEAAVPAEAPGISEPLGSGATAPETTDGNSIVNPDGSITRQLPDGSTQTLARLPGGAMIVTKTTPPGGYSQPAPSDSSRSRGWRRRSR